MRELLPEYWTKGHSHPAGLFAAWLNQSYAAVQLDAQGRNPYETLYHEYYHTITVPYIPDLPVWLSEGLAEFYGHTDIEEKYVGLGQADPALLQELQNSSLIPLSVLFKVDHDSPYYNEANRTSIFYAESWALVHYLMFGDRMAHKSMLTTYLSALDQGKKQDEAASVAFGNLKKLQSDLQNYIRGAHYYYLRLPLAKISDNELKFRPLSEAEADAYRGGFSAVRGRVQDATTTLEEALRLDPNVALAYQYLGMTEFLQGQREKALESVSKAIALDPKNSFTRYMRAFLRSSGTGMRSSNPQIEEDLRQAIAISPDFAPSYGLLAVCLAAAGRHLEEALTLAQKAVSFEPGSSSYQLALAQVLARTNKLDEAGIAATRASAWARNPAEKASAESYKSYLDQVGRLQRQMTSTGSGQPETLKVVNVPSVGEHSGSPAAGTTAPVPTSLGIQADITVLSNSLGFDFTAYLKDTLAAVRNNLFSNLLRMSLSEQRNISLEFAILKDGTLEGMKIVSSSGDEAVDKATSEGIASSSPLAALPGDFKGQQLKLRFRLAYTPEVLRSPN